MHKLKAERFINILESLKKTYKIENYTYSMQTIKIKFTKIEVPEFEKKGLLPVRFHYKVNGEDMSIEKSFGYVNHDPAAFAGDLIAEVRHVCKKQARPDPMDYSLLSGYVN